MTSVSSFDHPPFRRRVPVPWSIRLALAACVGGGAAPPTVLHYLPVAPVVWLTGLATATFVVQLALAAQASRIPAATTSSPSSPHVVNPAVSSSASTAAPQTSAVISEAAQTALDELLGRGQVPLAALSAIVGSLDARHFVAVGGGLGSFAWVDYLRNSGVAAASIAVVGPAAEPYAQFRAFCRNSQIGDGDRLRSSSDACPDNLWGWPGYGVREFLRLIVRGRLRQASVIAWQLFSEPIAAVTYVPRAGDVYRAMDREARRIDWQGMWRSGWVEALRQTDDGRYLVVYRSRLADGSFVRRYLAACFVHLATGYPHVRRLPALVDYRARSGDSRRVVHAYEPHDHIYAELGEHGGTVLLQGRGIAASRILERLHQLRHEGGAVEVMHLLRSPRAEASTWRGVRRRVLQHWELQPFNWPKGAWGGEHREAMASADAAARVELARRWGGTTTAPRPEFERPVVSGLQEGWYHPRFGEIGGLDRGPDGRPEVVFASKAPLDESGRVQVSFVIDATGLEANRRFDPFWTDVASRYRLSQTAGGGLTATDDFELREIRQPHGAVFAAGVATLGNAFGPVDSFLGLQYAAQRSVDQLAAWGAPGVRRLSTWRSVTGWLRWALGRAPS